MENNCIFCKITRKQIGSNILYEDDDFQVILDISPATKGHAILISKKHFDNLFKMDESTAAKLFPVVLKVSKIMKEELNCSGFNLVQNNGKNAGQTVFHFHLHLIPRYENDGIDFRWNTTEYAENEAASIASKIYDKIQ
ncbi:MAG: HIT family protein [Clostridiales bacterium]|nr:HIT family protein [Clostridiales bacterium]